jgi:hypothetical protein
LDPEKYKFWWRREFSLFFAFERLLQYHPPQSTITYFEFLTQAIIKETCIVGLIPSSLIEIQRSFGGYASLFSIALPPGNVCKFPPDIVALLPRRE